MPLALKLLLQATTKQLIKMRPDTVLESIVEVKKEIVNNGENARIDVLLG